MHLLFEIFMMRFFQIMESFKMNGFNSTWREFFFVNRTAVPVEMDLRGVQKNVNLKPFKQAVFIEMNEGDIRSKRFAYPLKNRRLKAIVNLKKGYGGFAVVKDGKIIGDLWYSHSEAAKGGPIHADVKWLGIDDRERRSAYAYDMFVIPEERRGFVSANLLGGVIDALGKKGFEKLYGYYWEDNISALWTHRVLRFRELKRVKVNRFFLWKTSKATG